MTQHGRSIIVTYSNTLLIAIAICCLSVSLATWFVFLRPVPRRLSPAPSAKDLQAVKHVLAVPHREPCRLLDAGSDSHRRGLRFRHRGQRAAG